MLKKKPLSIPERYEDASDVVAMMVPFASVERSALGSVVVIEPVFEIWKSVLVDQAPVEDAIVKKFSDAGVVVGEAKIESSADGEEEPIPTLP